MAIFATGEDVEIEQVPLRKLRRTEASEEAAIDDVGGTKRPKTGTFCPHRITILQFFGPVYLLSNPPHSPFPSAMYPSIQSPQPVRPPGRTLEESEDVGHDRFPQPNRFRFEPPPLPSPLTSLVLQWLSQVPRTKSAPPVLEAVVAIPSTEPINRPGTAPPPRVEMSQGGDGPASSASSAIRLSTSDILYRELIFRNGIIFDPSGLEIEDEIQDLLKTRILKERDALEETAIRNVMDKAVELMDAGETKASELLETDAFPVRRRGIAGGRSLVWSSEPLPVNPKYQYRLAAPKPDFHYGYPLGRKGDWTAAEMAVLEHGAAQPYIQPTWENWCPFLTFELKSEATGGVLYTAENQAVGSAVHGVASLRWLLGQASPSTVPSSTAAIAITGALSPQLCVFYIAWFSTRRNCYIVSMFAYTVLMEKSGIQRCHEIVGNTIDYGMDVRKPIIRDALARLNPVPRQW